MTDESRVELFELDRGNETAARILPSDRNILDELIKALAPHPGGLRRWSVMRTIRKERESAAREVPQKFEDEIERIFRRYCADAVDAKTGPCAAKDAYFFRPKEKAGEVWSIFPERVKAWRDAEPAEASRDLMSCRGNRAQPYRGA
jgi:hypothetical protein